MGYSSAETASETNVRIGIWAPEGFENLPFAAKLFLEQLPEGTFCWSSQEPTLTTDFPDQLDYCMLFTSAPPPPAPSWRKEISEKWILFPGSAATWSEVTREKTEEWEPDTVLSDLFPDEVDNEFWYEWWKTRDFGFLPVIAEKHSQPIVRTCSAVVVGNEVPSKYIFLLKAISMQFNASFHYISPDSPNWRNELSNVLEPGGFVLWCSVDPTLVAYGIDYARLTGADLIILGHDYPKNRCEWMKWDTPDFLRLPTAEGSLRIFTQKILKRIAEGSSQAKTRDRIPFGWMGWMNSLTHEAETLPSWSAVRVEPSIASNRLKRAVCGLLAEDFSDEYLWNRAFREIIDGSDSEKTGSIQLLDKLVPNWWSNSLSLGDVDDCAILAKTIYLYSCDGYVHGNRREKMCLVGQLFESADSAKRFSEFERVLHVTSVGIVGDLHRCENLLQSLKLRFPHAVRMVVRNILRAWLPGIEGWEEEVIPADGLIWLLRIASDYAELGLMDWIDVGQIAVLVGDAGVAQESISKWPVVRGKLAQTVVECWLANHQEIATDWWTTLGRENPPESGNTGGHFWECAADTLCSVGIGGSKSNDPFSSIALEKHAPANSYPSNQRGFIVALCYHQIGQDEKAREWYLSVLGVDPLAELRRGLVNL